MENNASQKNKQVRPLFGRFIKDNLPALFIILITLLITLLLGGLMEVFPVRYMQQIVNELITNATFTKVLRLVGLWHGCRIVGSIANFYSGSYTGKTASKCGGYFRETIFNRITNSYYWDRKAASTADVTTRLINDASELGDVIIKPLYVVGKNLLIFLWFVIFLAQIDWILLLVCIPLGVIMLALGSANAKKSRSVVREIRIHETKLARVILESLGAAKEMIVYKFGHTQSLAFKKDKEIVVDAQADGLG